MASADLALQLGSLRVAQKKKKAEVAFVGAYHDALRVWKAEADYQKKAKPKLSLVFADARNVEVDEAVLRLTLKKIPYAVEAETPAQLREWLHVTRHVAPGFLPADVEEALLTEPICEGYMSAQGLVTRRSSEGGGEGREEAGEEESERFFFQLMAQEFVYFADELAARSVENERKGDLQFSTIVQCHADDDSFSLILEGRQAPVVLRAAGEEERLRWTRACGWLLREQLGKAFEDDTTQWEATVGSTFPFDRDSPTFWQTMVSDDPSQWKRKKKGFWWGSQWSCKGCTVTSKDNPPSVMHAKRGVRDISLCEDCFAKAVPAPKGGAEALIQDNLAVSRGGKKEQPLFVVLSKEELLFFKSVDLYLKSSSSKPLSKQPLSAIQTVEALGPDKAPTRLPTKLDSLGSKTAAPRDRATTEDTAASKAQSFTLVLRMSDGTPELHLRMRQGIQEATHWNIAIQKAAGLIAPDAADDPGAAGKEKSQREPQPETSKVESHDRQEAKLADSQEELRSKGSAVEAATTAGTAAPADADAGGDSPAAAGDDEEGGEAEAEGSRPSSGLMKEGILLVSVVGEDDDLEEEQFIRISAEQGLETWADPPADGEEPQSQVFLDDLSFEDKGDVILVRVEDDDGPQYFQLRAPSAEEHSDWVEFCQRCKEPTSLEVGQTGKDARASVENENETNENELNENERNVLAQGPVVLQEGDAKAQEFFAVLSSQDFCWSGEQGGVVVGRLLVPSIEEIDVQEDGELVGLVIRSAERSELSFAAAEGSRLCLEDWAEAFELAIEGQAAAPSRNSSAIQASPLTGWEKKLRAIFEQCDEVGSGKVSLAQLSALCKASPLVEASFAAMQEEVGSTLDVAAMFQALADDSAEGVDAPKSWEELRCLYELRFVASTEDQEEARLLCEGPLELIQSGFSEGVSHVCLFTTCLDTYEDAAEAAKGSSCTDRVEREDVRAFQATADGFALELVVGERVEFRVVADPSRGAGPTVDDWAAALPLAFPDAASASASASPAPGSSVGASEQRGGAGPSSGRPPRHSRRESKGSGELAGDMRRGGGKSWEPPEQHLLEAKSGMLARWIASLPALPVKTGLLGVQDKGRTFPRFCALFGDRFDEWDKPTDAAHGLRPARRTAARDIVGFETVGTGFILNIGRKRLGMRVRSNDEMHLWSQALLSVLAPGPRPEGWTTVESTRTAATAARKSKVRPAPKARTDRSIKEAPIPDRYHPVEPKRKTIFTARAVQYKTHAASGGRSFKFNTHKGARQAAAETLGPAVASLLRFTCHPGAADYVHSDLSQKINFSPTITLEEVHRRPTVAEKITGTVSVPQTRKKKSVCTKITDYDKVISIKPRRSVGHKAAGNDHVHLDSVRRTGAASQEPRSVKSADCAAGRSEHVRCRRAKAAREVAAKVTASSPIHSPAA